MKALASAMLALLLVLGVAGRFGPDLAKPRVIAAAERALHRDVSIAGLALLPAWPPTLQASDVTVAGLGRVPRVRVRFAMDSLLGGRAAVQEIELLQPTLTLAPDDRGRVVLVPPRSPGGAAPRPQDAPQGPPQPPPRIVVRDGTVTVHDPRIGPDITLAISGTRQGAAYDFDVHGIVSPGVRPAWLAGMAVSARVASGQPVHATVQGSLHGQDVHMAIDTGTPETVAGGRDLPVTLVATAAGTSLHATGTIGDLAAAAGLDLAVTLRAADERLLGALLGWSGAAGSVSLDTHLSGSAAAFALHDLDLQIPQGDVVGELAGSLGARPALRGTLRAGRFDADALLALAKSPPPTPQAPAPAPAAAGTPPPPSRWVIPDRRLPWASLARADADLTLSAAVLQVGGVAYRALATHAVLQSGRLAVTPFTAALPGSGSLAATLHLDANASPPAASLTLHAPAVALAPVLAAWRLPDAVSGQAAVDADLRSAGASWHVLAAGLDGTASLHLDHGAIDAGLLAALRLPVKLPGGSTPLRCAAFGFVAQNGVLSLAPLVADADRLRIEGAGQVDLARETLALHLLPLLRGGPGLVIPVQLSGPWRAPKVAIGSGPAVLAPDLACPADQPAVPVLGSTPGKKHPKPIDLLRSLLR